MEQVHMQVVKTNFVNKTAHTPPARLNRQESAIRQIREPRKCSGVFVFLNACKGSQPQGIDIIHV